MSDNEGRECGDLFSELDDNYPELASAVCLHQHVADDQRAALRDLLRFREQVRREAFEEAALASLSPVARARVQSATDPGFEAVANGLHLRLDPGAPVASLLDQTGLSQSELGRRLGGGQSLVSAPLRRERVGGTVGLAWLRRAAQAAGFRLEIRLVPEGGRKST